MFMSFIAMIDPQFAQKVEIVQSESGTNFNCMKNYFPNLLCGYTAATKWKGGMQT